MENMENENIVTETEAVEVTQEAPKTYTQEDVDRMVKEKLDEVLPGKIARREAKIRREYEKEFGDLGAVLKAGTGKQDLGEIAEDFRKHYAGKGVNIPEKSSYSDRDIQILAKAEAEEIIQSGYDEVVEEVNRLSKKGIQNMTVREKVMFQTLANHRQSAEQTEALRKLGVGEDVYNSAEFKSFAADFKPGTPVEKIHNLYIGSKPKKSIKPMGSMKNGHENTAKDYYSPEEIARLTEDDLKDDRIWNAVRRSMTGKA